MNIYLIVTFAMIMLVAVGWFWKIRHRQVNAVASIVTIIGVLGTFFGIAIGLHQFDAYALKESVPKLLAGLKIAFWTSILGIAGSVWLKWSALNERKRQADLEEIDTGATVDDPVELLQNILAVEREEGQATRETLRSIERSLTGEGDSTVLTQLQKLRTTFSDKQDDLIRAFNEFADKMAENNTNALIEALEEVMRDFNAKINEQFGENFKQLNEAVGRINEWQEQYRQQMDELAAQFQVAAASIEKSRESLEIIAERSGAIVSNSEKLDPILQALQHQIQQLNNHLTAFSALADNARDAFPIIEDRLNQLTNDFSTVIRNTIDDSHASMQSQREALTNQSQQLERTVENTSRHIQEQTENIFEQTTIRIEEVIDSTFQGLTGSLISQSQQLQSIVTETNQGLENTLQTQSGQLEAMAGNISQRLQTLSNDFSTVVQETIDNSHASMQNQREALNEFSSMVRGSIDNAYEDMVRQREAFQTFTGRIEDVIRRTNQGLENTVEETNRSIENTLQAQSRQLSTETERIFREGRELMTQQIQLLDTALQEELTKALESLGSQLTSLSRRFVDDYSPLTEKLRAVLEMASSSLQTSQYQQRQ